MRPNKTNFRLSFGHFGGQNVKKRKEEKKQRKKKKRKGMDLYVFVTLSMICMGYTEEFVWKLVVPLLGF